MHVYSRPITFSEFVDLYCDKGIFVELVDGSVEEMELVQLDHEKLSLWLTYILKTAVLEGDLGIFLTSRIAVEIDEFHGRLPDLLFVRKDRLDIVQQKGVFGAPDLIIEIVSPSDRPSSMNALEVDYRRLGVPEIVFINQKRRRVRILHKKGDGYEAEDLTSGPLRLGSMGGLTFQIEWLFQDPLPDERVIIDQILKRRR